MQLASVPKLLTCSAGVKGLPDNQYHNFLGSVLPPSSVATPRLNASVSWPACVGKHHKEGRYNQKLFVLR